MKGDIVKVERLRLKRDELEKAKAELSLSFVDILDKIETSNEELKKFKEELKDLPQYIIDREAKAYHIRKKLNSINKEADFHDELDRAIGFLSYLEEELTEIS